MSNALDNVFKLAQEVWVDEARWGVRGDGATDDTAALQACITANAGRVIHFGPRTYRITAPLVISADNTRLVGQRRRSFILNQGTGDAIHFQCTLTTQFGYLNNCGLVGLYILRNTHAATAGAGLRLTRCNSFVGDDFYILDQPEGLKIHGGQLNRLSNFQVFAASMSDVSGTTDTNLLGLYESEASTGVWQPCFTVRLTDFQVSGDNKVDVGMFVGNADGLQMTTAYFARGRNANIRFKNLRAASYIAAVTASDVYADAVNRTTGAQRCLDIPADGLASFVYNVAFSNSFFGNCVEDAVRVAKTVTGLQFTNCTFANANGFGLNFTGDTASNGGLQVTGCKFQSTGLSAGSTASLRVGNAAAASVVGNNFEGHSGTSAVILLNGTAADVSIVGNTVNTAAASDFTNSGTVTRLTMAGNSSNLSGSGLHGLRVANKENADAEVLDFFRKYTLTPEVRFGGLTTGITYSARTGNATRIGDFVFFTMDVTLSSKGSATGLLEILGLPVAAGTGGAVSAWINSPTSGVGDTSLQAVIPALATGIRIDRLLAGISTQLTDADVTNTTRFRIGGVYKV